MTARILARKNREDPYYLVRYLSDDSIHIRQRSQIKTDGIVRVGDTFPTQWGGAKDIEPAVILYSGDYQLMRQREQEEKSNIDNDSDNEWSPLRSPGSPSPKSPTPPSEPVPKRRRLNQQNNKTSVVKNLATVIGRGPPAPTPASTPETSDVFTFTGSPEATGPLTPVHPRTISRRILSRTDAPAADTASDGASTPTTHGHLTPLASPLPSTPTVPFVANKFQTQVLKMLGDLSKKQDVILRRLTALETTTNSIIATQHRLQTQQPSLVPTCSTDTRVDSDVFNTIPEEYHIDMETLRGIHGRSYGPGNFAKKIVERLFPELFGPGILRMEYSYYGGGCQQKKQLDPQRREIVRIYVCHFFPDVRPIGSWKDMVVSKINEGLRRPIEKKSRPKKKLQTPGPVCDGEEEEQRVEYTSL